MSNMVDIQELTKSSVPEIADAAKRALELYDLVMTNQLSKSEFDELLDDVVKLEKINSEMFSVEVMRRIVAAYELILTLKTLASII